jgi:type IV pilus assembly protein PilA
MIVVAIIGILAAVAMPVYQDYAARAKVSEASTISAEARLAVIMSAGEGRLAAGLGNSELGLPDSGELSSRYVESVVATGVSPDEGKVVVTMRNTGSAADGKTIDYTITCTSARCQTTVGGDVPAKFLPKP